MQRGVDIAADRVPGFPAESAVHQVIKIVPLRGAFQQKNVALFEKGTGAGFRIGQILLLVFGEHFGIEHGDAALMLHNNNLL